MFTLCPVEKVKNHSTILLLDLSDKMFYSTFLFSFHFFCFTPKLYIKNGIQYIYGREKRLMHLLS